MAPARTARERAREEITAEILSAARARLQEAGPGELSLRAVARDVGMVSSAVYRYFPSRDDLLTALILQCYDELGEAVERADAAVEDRTSWAARRMAHDSLPVRLAVYLKLLGPFDDCYPSEWLDPATGELPTMGQLAPLDGLSLPTLRKRRDAAIVRLNEVVGIQEEQRWA